MKIALVSLTDTLVKYKEKEVLDALLRSKLQRLVIDEKIYLVRQEVFNEFEPPFPPIGIYEEEDE